MLQDYCKRCGSTATPKNHRCLKIIPSDEYVSNKLGVCMLWTADFGWRSYEILGGDVIQDLTAKDVVDWIKDEDAGFFDPDEGRPDEGGDNECQ